MSRALLSVSAATVRAGESTLLDGVDLDVRAGEVLAVVGPNGAGKSTLLSVVAGDRVPDAGTVTWTGTPLAAVRAAELARLRGVLLQENHVSFPFRVVDVVRMGRAPWRGTPAQDRDEQVVAGALDAADVTHLAARSYPTLSGGEKARASLARVLAQEPTLLLLDEPTAALDVRHQEHVLAQARTHSRAGDAVVVVLHDLALAAAWADRVLVLERGRAAGLGTPDQVLTSELLTRVYGHPIDVVPHPVTGGPLVLPRRGVEPTDAAVAPVAPAAAPAVEETAEEVAQEAEVVA
ncbi:ABC transporter related protein [Xylanimonas cellulosilytica DSM 15894]|uniref:ABC transporter related protein n=1 Tax=Xylanimonas cellulosilytica (strain DSM 15894 / JCM 12276 / CECT 5975 / KCTC 9989 / LMG 20990 / NBRC 107835 / XIL07) TaxID=446471 RepID=D1BXY4_XYLCX|nr:heme ABC transporter ATP-binding protein [Xylanimonas cellulosilytica]ACZ31775.1 ABC transporter related protein [Xylanimonas cellulosilytica DSM 15894]